MLMQDHYTFSVAQDGYLPIHVLKKKLLSCFFAIMSLVVNCELHWNGSTLHCLAHLKAGTKHQYMISALSSLH